MHRQGEEGAGREVFHIKLLEGISEQNESLGQDSGGLRKSKLTGASRENRMPQGLDKKS